LPPYGYYSSAIVFHGLLVSDYCSFSTLNNESGVSITWDCSASRNSYFCLKKWKQMGVLWG
jgi:hypothetical protein